jgi:hypothetical protein
MKLVIKFAVVVIVGVLPMPASGIVRRLPVALLSDGQGGGGGPKPEPNPGPGKLQLLDNPRPTVVVFNN